jgi:hypothetical protein
VVAVALVAAAAVASSFHSTAAGFFPQRGSATLLPSAGDVVVVVMAGAVAAAGRWQSVMFFLKKILCRALDLAHDKLHRLLAFASFVCFVCRVLWKMRDKVFFGMLTIKKCTAKNVCHAFGCCLIFVVRISKKRKAKPLPCIFRLRRRTEKNRIPVVYGLIMTSIYSAKVVS